MRFQGKITFVTGGASGLGEASARRFADEDAKVVVADLNEDAAKEVAHDLPDALVIRVDTSDASSVERAVLAAEQEYGRIDVLVNNAGVDGEQQRLHEMTEENWDHVRSINGDGAFHVLKYGIAALLRSGGGAVVNMASTAALTAQNNLSPYTFTKAGLVGLTRSAAVEYAAENIRVNAVAPTGVLTPLVEHFIETSEDPDAVRGSMDSMNPMPGVPMPEDVASVVAFLASDDAKWVTGHTIPVDGGYVAK